MLQFFNIPGLPVQQLVVSQFEGKYSSARFGRCLGARATKPTKSRPQPGRPGRLKSQTSHNRERDLSAPGG
jgi:hypothetical protein